MKTKNLFIIASLSALVGIATYIYFNEWIIIRWPSVTGRTYDHTGVAHKKPCKLWYWSSNSWKADQTDLIWSDDVTHNCMYLLNSWLTFLDEERIMDRKVSLQTAIVSASGKELYLSFDRSPFNPQSTTHQKWMLIEG